MQISIGIDPDHAITPRWLVPPNYHALLLLMSSLRPALADRHLHPRQQISSRFILASEIRPSHVASSPSSIVKNSAINPSNWAKIKHKLQSLITNLLTEWD
jgi:hypothetical protein